MTSCRHVLRSIESRLMGKSYGTMGLTSCEEEIMRMVVEALRSDQSEQPQSEGDITFAAFRSANVKRCARWHSHGTGSWSPSDWMTAVTGELGELASLLKMRNRERDGLPGNKFSPTDEQIADELADVFAYLDLLAAALGVNLGRAAVEKFNKVSERIGFPDRIELRSARVAEPVGHQVTRAALKALWTELGAAHQTEAMEIVRALKTDRASLSSMATLLAEARRERDGLLAFKRGVDEALNSGDGSYRP